MPPATHGEQELVPGREPDGGPDGGHIDTARNETRPPVNHAIINLARRCIARLARLKQLATEAGLEGVDGGMVVQ
jgi:hypothetical protein